jgi:hypothetical protein
MKRRLQIITALAALMAMVMAPSVAVAQPTGELSSDVLADVLDAETGDAAGDFEGTVTVDEIVRDGTDLIFSGTIDGVFTDLDGVPTEISETFETVGTLGEGGNQARCDILFLDLGPINLDVLGLVIDLSDVQLDIFAEPGPGNLLGNLLCAVAGLLDGPGLLGGIADTVDRLLGRINNLLG